MLTQELQEAENRQHRQDWLSHQLLRSHETVPLPLERSVPERKPLPESKPLTDGLDVGLYVPIFLSAIAMQGFLTLSSACTEVSCWIGSL